MRNSNGRLKSKFEWFLVEATQRLRRGARIVSSLHPAGPYNASDMRWTFVVPGGLLPAAFAADVLRDPRAAPLAELLARAESAALEPIGPTDGSPDLDWLWREFGGTTATPITAPYAWRALHRDGEPPEAVWFATPVHFAFARDHLLVAPLDDLDKTERTALAQVIDTCAQSSGARLLGDVGRTWFMAFDRPWALDAIPLPAALGLSVADALPQGADEVRWRKLLTEIQIEWHAHPVNEAREARGQRSANGLWLHGGGTWEPLPRTPFGAVAGATPVLQGWALAAGVPASQLHEGEALPPNTTHAVSWIKSLAAPARLQHWDAWLARVGALATQFEQLKPRAFAAGFDLELVLGGERHVRRALLSRSARWKVWRRAKLETLLCETASPMDRP
jgi:hypothetical protein